MSSKIKIGFAGTPEIAKLVLASILKNNTEVKLVLTQPDRPAGRGLKLTASPVKELALENGIPVFQPEKLRGNNEALAYIKSFDVDLWVVVAYGLIVPQEFLDMAIMGAVNIHVSLLPSLRGAAPIQRSLLQGDLTTGVTIMQMDQGLDTGDILYQQSMPIETSDTSGSLHDKLALLGAKMIVEFINNPSNYPRVKQDNTKASYAHKLSKEEAKINWHQLASEIELKIRGYNPFPIAHTVMNNQLVKIYQAKLANVKHSVTVGTILKLDDNGILVACGDNTSLYIRELQLAGSKRIMATDFIIGNKQWLNQTLGEV